MTFIPFRALAAALNRRMIRKTGMMGDDCMCINWAPSVVQTRDGGEASVTGQPREPDATEDRGQGDWGSGLRPDGEDGMASKAAEMGSHPGNRLEGGGDSVGGALVRSHKHTLKPGCFSLCTALKHID